MRLHVTVALLLAVLAAASTNSGGQPDVVNVQAVGNLEQRVQNLEKEPAVLQANKRASKSSNLKHLKRAFIVTDLDPAEKAQSSAPVSPPPPPPASGVGPAVDTTAASEVSGRRRLVPPVIVPDLNADVAAEASSPPAAAAQPVVASQTDNTAPASAPDAPASDSAPAPSNPDPADLISRSAHTLAALNKEYHAIEGHLARIDSARKSLGRALQTAIQGGASDSQDDTELGVLKKLVTHAHAVDRIDKGIAQLEQERALLVADGNKEAVAVIDQQLQIARAHRSRLQAAQASKSSQPHLTIQEIVESLKAAIQQHQRASSHEPQSSTAESSAVSPAAPASPTTPAESNAAASEPAPESEPAAPTSAASAEDAAAAPKSDSDSALPAPASDAAPAAEPADATTATESFVERMGDFEADLQRLRGRPHSAAAHSSGRTAEELLRLAESNVHYNERLLRQLRQRRP